MSGTPLLLASLLFSVVGVVTDSRRHPDMGAALWWPTIWFMLAVSRPLAYWFNPDYAGLASGDVGEGSPLNQAVLGTLMAFALIVLLRRRLNWRQVVRDNAALALVLAYVVISIGWSGHPAVAARRVFRLVGDVLMVLVVLSRGSPFTATKVVLKRLGYVLIPLSLVLIKGFDPWGVIHRWDGTVMWTGVTSQKNSLGQLTSVVLLVFVVEMVRTWRDGITFVQRSTDAIIVFLSVWLLIGSHSATSAVTLIAALGVVVWIYRQRNSVNQLGFLTAVMIAAAAVALLSSNMIELIVTLTGRDMTFTGRTRIWEQLREIGARRPILGVGYGSLWGVGELGYYLHTTIMVNQAHNGYLDIYLQLGIMGLVLVGFVVIQGYRNILSALRSDFDYAAVRMAFFLMILVSNVTESSLLMPSSTLWVLFLVVSARAPGKTTPKQESLQGVQASAGLV